jgi:hypothetical protein
VSGEFKSYQVTGSFPTQRIAIAQKPGKLTYTKVVIHDRFLAESCAIADYNRDGIPDVSSGRIWYQGPDFKTEHPFRDGHGALPALGAAPEIDTGNSDDTADYALDVDGDGWTDIVNIASIDTDEVRYTEPKFGRVQPHATAYWYRNPGPAQFGDPMWNAFLMHGDVRGEHHGLFDANGDGFPEIFGACKTCNPATTKGYYQRDPTNPINPWRYHAVTSIQTFPFGGLGKLHGEGAGDFDGDGLADLLERGGIWLQRPGGLWNETICTGKGTPAGCGWIKTAFSDGLPDNAGNKGPSHMFAADMDKDGLTDVVAADWAHGQGVFWYRQGAGFSFTKYRFVGDVLFSPGGDGGNGEDLAKWGVAFSQPHALEVVDMDLDGRPDVVTGKMRFAQPRGYGDPDLDGTPFLYVFKNVATPDARSGGPITLQPVQLDPAPGASAADLGKPAGGMGVGRQIAVGHVDTDGILDVCIASKVGLAVFLGK